MIYKQMVSARSHYLGLLHLLIAPDTGHVMFTCESTGFRHSQIIHNFLSCNLTVWYTAIGCINYCRLFSILLVKMSILALDVIAIVSMSVCFS